MYIFRWLMKHPLIILLLYFLSIGAILFNMSEDIVPRDEIIATTQHEQQESSNLTVALINENVTEQTDQAIKDAVADSEAKNAVMAKAIQAPKVSEDKVASARDDIIAEPVNPSTQTPVSSDLSAQFSEMNAEELLVMAREAYWNNGLDESAQIYQRLIEMNPDVIDYKGELGNVYWRQGFPKKAAILYAEISMPMIEEGNAERVANMVGFIGLFFPDEATKIHHRLQSGQ